MGMTNLERERSFLASHGHGFIRTAVATPRVHVGDPVRNGEAILKLAAQASEGDVDIVVFPELSLSAYAIDDLFLQEALLQAVEQAVVDLAEASRDLAPVLLVGAPLRRGSALYNCAVVLSRGKILGVVPKTFLPNYREYYEKRWFASGRAVTGSTIRLGGTAVPFGTDLIFEADDFRDFIFHAEICEDIWAPTPPSTEGALGGALLLCNLSASNIVVGKSDDRHLLCRSQSTRCLAAYAYSAAGAGESTNDLAWDGQGMIYEMGDLLAESVRFSRSDQLVYADVDLQRIRLERMRTPTFHDAAIRPEKSEPFRRVLFQHEPNYAERGLIRPIRRFPYVPDEPSRLDEDCFEAFNIQVAGLIRRFESTPGDRLVIGISGGLDSTHALIVAAKACDLLGLPRTTILGFTMPGFATGDATKSNAWRLMEAFGITGEEIDIRPAARQMLADMAHPFANGEPIFDIAFENVQAGLRPTISSAWRTSGTASSSAPGICRNWLWDGAPTVSATR
ncbi:hypothetical protein GCM10011335_12260 [Aureimonas glaciei]|uniref:Glutamine-dependent NAD(+) synthetase n=1 Tax=Aureimonas glaciei TaxID=1776957 RepID=A0A916XUN7_9HYPH|nr:hypothetical protein GCM10011335_12260 [Aureimonas glaciei]